MRRIVIVAALVALTGCSEREVGLWLAWWQQDPVAAEAFANTAEVQAQLSSDGGDESEPAADLQVAVEPQLVESRYGTAVWDTIARCESGGDWGYPPVTNRTGTYSGGLMIGHRWWPGYGGTEFAALPYQATKQQQIIVAERIADDVGLDRGWQCWG